MAHIRAAFDPTGAKDAVADSRSGCIYCCGASDREALGLNRADRKPIHMPHLIKPLLDEHIEQASCGWRHTVFIAADGAAYSCGEGEHGKLGHADEEPVAVPRRIEGLMRVRVGQASCGRSHTAFTTLDREDLFTCGLGLYGQLGHGSLNDEHKPRRVHGLEGGASVVSCGDLHTLVLRADGRALSCGYNESGRLGRALDDGGAARVSGTTELQARHAPECSERLVVLPLHAPLAAASEAFYVMALSAGGAHSALVYADGSVYTCGRGDMGQLGHGVAKSELQPKRVAALKTVRVRRAACGTAHSLFLTSDGVPHACGCGGMGRLGVGSRDNALTPIPVKGLHSHVVVQISAGNKHSGFVTDLGAALMCGDDGFGQCGINANSRSTALLPTAPPKFSASAAVTALGVSCGGQHSAFLVRGVVDPRVDLQQDQLSSAAQTIARMFRGGNHRKLQEAARRAEGRKRMPAAQRRHTREEAAEVIQTAFRYHNNIMRAERAADGDVMAGLREGKGGWARVRRQFVAAKVGKGFFMSSPSRPFSPLPTPFEFKVGKGFSSAAPVSMSKTSW